MDFMVAFMEFQVEMQGMREADIENYVQQMETLCGPTDGGWLNPLACVAEEFGAKSAAMFLEPRRGTRSACMARVER